MKLRIEPGSLRLRLGGNEIQQLEQEKFLEQNLMPGHLLRYGVYGIKQQKSVALNFENNHISLQLPLSILEEFLSTSPMEMNWMISVGDPQNLLQVILEKDFHS